MATEYLQTTAIVFPGSNGTSAALGHEHSIRFERSLKAANSIITHNFFAFFNRCVYNAVPLPDKLKEKLSYCFGIELEKNLVG